MSGSIIEKQELKLVVFLPLCFKFVFGFISYQITYFHKPLTALTFVEVDKNK